MDESDKYLVVISGPTAVGKTYVAIEIASWLKTEIISADSRQIYKEMRIGTAAPSNEELSAIHHHFIGTKSVTDYYNASMFEFEALEIINRLFKTKHCAVMTGGSGMYIDAVCRGIDDLPGVDSEIRDQFKLEYKNFGLEGIKEKLKQIDPEYYKKVDLNNPKRILKALEIFATAGRPYSSFLTGLKKERPFNIIKIGLDTDRDVLYTTINNRVERMFAYGLIEEVKSLVPFKHLNSLNTVGYKEVFDYLDGKTNLDEAIDRVKRHSRQYARRQLTWFRRDKDIRWFNPGELNSIKDYICEKSGSNGPA